MFEDLGFETLTAPQVSVMFALLVGAAFGFLAERSKFCFRRSLVGEDRRQAWGVWLLALATATVGVQFAIFSGLIAFDDHRFMVSELPILSILIGGGLFGAGMVLTRGCVSRLTILSASGNLRAATVILIFAVVAHATLKGVLSPFQSLAGSVTLDLGDAIDLTRLVPAWALTLALVVLALWTAVKSQNKPSHLALAVLIGLLVPTAWVGTGYVLYDDFDPITMESLSFTAPTTEALFWTVASTSIPAGFGTGLIGGTLAGALIASLAFKTFTWQSFESPRQTGRYALGAVFMGVGAVLAGGCTIGAGLAGIPTFSVATILALFAIAGGAVLTHRLVDANPSDAVLSGPSSTPMQQPAK